MNFSVPILVNQTRGAEPVYLARPLFHPGPEASGKLLERVLSKLGSALRKELTTLAQSHRLEELSNYAFSPTLYEQTFRVELHHKKRTVKGNFLVVVLPEQQPRVAFCPDLPDLWFHVPRGADLKSRLLEALDHFYTRGGGAELENEHGRRSWVSELELSFRVPEVPPKPGSDPNRMILGSSPVNSGWMELERVGRNLDDQFPHDLNACLCRQAETDRLERALKRKERTPQLVVGPRKVGKTSLLHEMVRRYRVEKGGHERRFWLLSPQRLISGMSYVGQWEARLLAILKHAAQKDLVLVLDDLLGLFSAGVSRDSNLCVADVLKPYLQRGEVRILAEATPESLSILREKDRGFADLFWLTYLSETSERDTLRIALEEIRSGERLHACAFELEALTAAIDLQRRYVRDAVFPGKSASFLRKLAARHRGETIDRDAVIDYFHSLSGIDGRLLQDRAVLHREEVHHELQEQVMGQPAAVDAATDAVMMAKARLCDPSRPIASLLFVGPTGVGKTECAKALARFLFNDEARMIRFDMNEYVSPYSATRLVGTFHQPDGLLTSAVRRRPFCVLLLDEIEKAHHEVFNLLLQLLGDGRLTDARGRTVDFTQAIVVMTSNLGVREASKPIGLRNRRNEEGLAYVRAVEQFFPPELFNRLDRVVPFGRLSRADTEVLAQRQLSKILAREGLVRRQCLLHVSAAAMEKIVDLGFHPHLGARALKRSIESSISAPVSARLTEMKPHAPTVIAIEADGETSATGGPELRVSVRELCSPPRWNGPRASTLEDAQLQILENVLQAREKSLESPTGLLGEESTSAQIWYYSVQDRLRRARAVLARLRGLLNAKAPPQRRVESEHFLLQAEGWEGLLESPSLERALKDLSAALPARTQEVMVHAKLAELLAEMSLLEGDGAEEEAVLELVCGASHAEWADLLADLYADVFTHLELNVTRGKNRLEIRGPQAALLAQSEAGYHLFATDDGLALVEVTGVEKTVTRLYSAAHGTLDLRTGWMCPELPNAEQMELLLLSGLPAPALEDVPS